MRAVPARLALVFVALAAGGCGDPLVGGELALDGTADIPAMLVPGAPGVPLLPIRLIDSTVLEQFQSDQLTLQSATLRSLSVWTLRPDPDGGVSPDGGEPCSADPAGLSTFLQVALVVRPKGGGSGDELASATFASSLTGCDEGCCALAFAPDEGVDLLTYPEPWALWLDAIGHAPDVATRIAGRVRVHITGSLAVR